MAAQELPEVTELWLDTVLNEAPTGHVLRYAVDGGRFSADADDLREIGLRWEGSDSVTGMVALDAIRGITARYEPRAQRMRLQADVDLLDGDVQRLGAPRLRIARPDPSMRAPGAVLDYALDAQRYADEGVVLAARTDLRVFGVGPGEWFGSWNIRHLPEDGPDQGTDTVRLDTRWTLDFPERMVQLVVGDDITGAVSWSRPTRFGGIRVGRDFDLQPYRITTPLAAFAGQAALPSTVDLIISGVQEAREPVAPGRFELETQPQITGAGIAHLVLTDINGVVRDFNVPFYTTSRLLAAGLWDGSAEVGRVRRDYGLRSFDYGGRTFGSGTLRYGVNDRLTLEAHAEVDARLDMAGVGAVWLPGPRIGVFNASYARSRTEGVADGTQYGLGYQWNGSRFHFDGSTIWRDATFRDLASLENSPLPRRTDQAFAGIDTALGHFSAGYVRQRGWEGEEARIASFGWSREFGRAGSVHVTAFRDLELEEHSVWLSWRIALDRYTYAGASLLHETESGNSISADIRRSINSDLGGFGWRLQAGRNGNGGNNGLAAIDWLGRYAGGELGVADTEAGSNAWASLYGGVVWMDGPPQLVRRIANAFAIVSTDGVPGVPVRLENRLVGYTDRHGRLLVDRLNPWENNKIGIDTLELPADMYIERTQLQVVPEGDSGVRVRFPMRPVHSLELTVVDASGNPLPVGSPVYAEGRGGDPLTVIGYDSELYLVDPAPGSRLHIDTAAGRCTVVVPPSPQVAAAAGTDTVVCR